MVSNGLDVDLLRRQTQTWENIPGELQKKIIEVIKNTIQDMIRQTHGIEKVVTGYDDNHELLRSELDKRSQEWKCQKEDIPDGKQDV